MYSRRATVAYDKVNISILSIENITDPKPVAVENLWLRLYTGFVMGAVNHTPNWDTDPQGYGSSATQYSFAYGMTYILRLYIKEFVAYNDGGRSLLRSFIAVPFQFSTSIRQYGNISQEGTDNEVTAVLAKGASRAIIAPWTVYTFGALAFTMTLWCIVLLVWISFFGPYFPNLSFFPEINITSRSSAQLGIDYTTDLDPNLEMADETLEDLTTLTRSNGLGNGLSVSVVDAIRNKRVYCGSLPGKREGEEVIVLVTRQGGMLKALNKYGKYA